MSFSVSTHRSQIPRSGLALGGIGAGSFEIRQDGGFTNWTIFNNAPLFSGNPYPYNRKDTFFFKLWIRVAGGHPRLVLLQIEDSHNVASLREHEAQYIFPWITGVDVIHFKASFPFAELEFQQDGLPLRILLRAWSPFIPGNVRDSALPVAFFDFTITSCTDDPVEVQLLAVLRNTVAYDQPDRIYQHRRIREKEFSAIVFDAGRVDSSSPTTGSICLTSCSAASTAYMGWEHPHPYYERCLREYPLPEVEDTPGRNPVCGITGQPRASERCFATLGIAARLEDRNQVFSHGYCLAWHFPNLYAKGDGSPMYESDTRFPPPGKPADKNQHAPRPRPLEGHYYGSYFGCAESVARHAQGAHHRLLEETTAFHTAFFDSDIPGFALDQINSHLNTLHTSTWLTQTRMFGVMEGLNPEKSFAGIATTDVSMYGQIALSLLFPELDRMTVDMWAKFQNPNGSVIHTLCCDSVAPHPSAADGHRVDLPAQFAFLALRTAIWAGDEHFLRTIWPAVKQALAYVLRERDANGDQLPDMAGVMCSYDNFPMHGVAPYVVTQWLAALSLALKVAGRLDDQSFINNYATHLQRGADTLENTTWNGEYFNLFSDPQMQTPQAHLGCLSDQMLGEALRYQVGCPPLLDGNKTRTALRAILRMNYKPDQGLRNCQWPEDDFLHEVSENCWVDQANTCWTGVELQFASHLAYAGMQAEALEVIRNVDNRYRRNGMYWDHQEFGGHYFRPLSALGIPNAFLGVAFDGETLVIAPNQMLPYGRWCVLVPGGYCTYRVFAGGASLKLRGGNFAPLRIQLPVVGNVILEGFVRSYDRQALAGQTVFTREQSK